MPKPRENRKIVVIREFILHFSFILIAWKLDAQVLFWIYWTLKLQPDEIEGINITDSLVAMSVISSCPDVSVSGCVRSTVVNLIVDFGAYKMQGSNTLGSRWSMVYFNSLIACSRQWAPNLYIGQTWNWKPYVVTAAWCGYLVGQIK